MAYLRLAAGCADQGKHLVGVAGEVGGGQPGRVVGDTGGKAAGVKQGGRRPGRPNRTAAR